MHSKFKFSNQKSKLRKSVSLPQDKLPSENQSLLGIVFFKSRDCIQIINIQHFVCTPSSWG